MTYPTSVVPDASISDLQVYFIPELDHLDHSVKVAVDDVVGTPELDPPDAEFRGRRFWPTPTDGMRWSRGAGSGVHYSHASPCRTLGGWGVSGWPTSGTLAA